MRTFYNRIAGQSLDRLAALSDGIFAVAMTLLVLNLHVPSISITNPSDLDLLKALVPLLQNLLTYLMSFLTLGIFWVGQQTQLNHLEHGDRDLAWIHLGFLLAVSLTPFSTALLAQYINVRTALVIYWFNIFLLGAMLFGSWQYSMRAGLVKDEMTAEMRSATTRRIVIAQALYAFGALLCVFNTYVSIVVIVLLQLNYAIAPRLPLLYRI